MKKKIKSISFLHEGNRIKAYRTPEGKFKIENSDIIIPPMELVTNRLVKEGDPVLTLDDGEKVRVYQGGDPTQFVVTAVSILENHERRNKLRNRLLESTKRKSEKSQDRKQMSMDFNAAAAGCGFDTIDEDPDEDPWGFDHYHSLWLSDDS